MAPKKPPGLKPGDTIVFWPTTKESSFSGAFKRSLGLLFFWPTTKEPSCWWSFLKGGGLGTLEV